MPLRQREHAIKDEYFKYSESLFQTIKKDHTQPVIPFEIIRQKKKERDKTVDIVRGITLCFLFGGNMIPFLERPLGSAYRYAPSYGAAIFIMLAAMMIQLSCISKKNTHHFFYFLKRGFFILSIGAILDLTLHHAIPFTSIDILTMMGFSTPFIYLIARSQLSTRTLFYMIIVIVATTPLLHHYFGYNHNLDYITLDHPQELSWANILKRWFIDGDFAIFPWFSYFLFGLILGRLRFKDKIPMTNGHFILSALSLFIIGQALFLRYPGPIYERLGFGEFFYPPSVGLIIATLGIAMLHFIIVDYLKQFKPLEKALNLFTVFGESPLFIYFIHEYIIFFFIAGILAQLHMKTINQITFHVVALTHGALVFMICLGLRRLKKRWVNMPIFAKWFLGS